MPTSGAQATKRQRVSKQPQDRRRDLLEAALHAFDQVGVDSTTVADITERAGVAKGTFYLYFDSKDHILAELWQRYLAGFQHRAAPLLEDASRPWPERITAVVTELVQHALAHAQLHRVIYRAANARALQMCRQANDAVIAVLADAVRRGAAAGELEPVESELAVRLLYHGIDGLLDDHIARDQAPRPEQLVAATTEFALRVLRPVPGAATTPTRPPAPGSPSGAPVSAGR